jgi:AraC-like DNA-binding protein
VEQSLRRLCGELPDWAQAPPRHLPYRPRSELPATGVPENELRIGIAPPGSAKRDDRHAGIPERKLDRATRFINERFDQALTIAEIAASAHISQFHFSRLFKQVTGHTVYQYVTSVRADRAKRLLAATDMPIVDVGAAVGYESQSHFTAVFRKVAGIAPAVYRRQSHGSSKAIFVCSAVAPRMPLTASIPTNEEQRADQTMDDVSSPPKGFTGCCAP